MLIETADVGEINEWFGIRFAGDEIVSIFARLAAHYPLVWQQAGFKMNRIFKEPEPFVSLAGCLLVATPQVTDVLFGQSVCLIVEHSKQGAAGVVLNRPFQTDVGPLWQHLTAGSTHTAEPPRHLHFGGPVSGPVVAVHDQEALAEAGNGSGVYLAAQIENLRKLVYIAPEHYRLFVGHAVWKEEQLEEEIRSGAWYVMPASADVVFSDENEMWHRGMRRIGNAIWRSVVGIDNVPDSPLLN